MEENMSRSDEASDALEGLLREHGLRRDTQLYRCTLPEFLQTRDDGSSWLTANDDPSEAVVNVYEGGHTETACQIGAGLAFAELAANQWREAGRVLVEVTLADVLDQGGRVYPVESVITERAWYVTLPSGGVSVRVLNE
jgi:hypothetical protein